VGFETIQDDAASLQGLEVGGHCCVEHRESFLLEHFHAVEVLVRKTLVNDTKVDLLRRDDWDIKKLSRLSQSASIVDTNIIILDVMGELRLHIAFKENRSLRPQPLNYSLS